jgi:hypothetical protein
MADHVAHKELARDVEYPVGLLPKGILDRLETVLLETQDRPELADLPPLAFAAGILVKKCFGFEVPNLTETKLVW